MHTTLLKFSQSLFDLMTAPNRQFDQLMSDAMSGSEEAAWEIAQTYTPYIIRTAQSNLTPQLQSKIDPQDLAQSVWATILLKGSDLSRLKSPKDLIAYLATATKNRVIDKARRYKSEVRNVQREESLGGSVPPSTRKTKGLQANPLYARDETPSAQVSARDHWNWILANASERDRQIVQLRLDGLSYDEIGLKLEIDEKTARRVMQRIVLELRTNS